jgi:heme/copper-type cytochrome/quinol oxidase subunit 1
MVHSFLFRRHRVDAPPLHTFARLLRGLVGLAVVASLLVVGLMVAFGVLVWAIFRGRWLSGVSAEGRAARAASWATPRPEAAARHADAQEVIDVEAREVPGAPVRP